jgi:hypothetical protein
MHGIVIQIPDGSIYYLRPLVTILMPLGFQLPSTHRPSSRISTFYPVKNLPSLASRQRVSAPGIHLTLAVHAVDTHLGSRAMEREVLLYRGYVECSRWRNIAKISCQTTMCSPHPPHAQRISRAVHQPSYPGMIPNCILAGALRSVHETNPASCLFAI